MHKGPPTGIGDSKRPLYYPVYEPLIMKAPESYLQSGPGQSTCCPTRPMRLWTPASASIPAAGLQLPRASGSVYPLSINPTVSLAKYLASDIYISIHLSISLALYFLLVCVSHARAGARSLSLRLSVSLSLSLSPFMRFVSMCRYLQM